jgi:hypothetical protein
MKAAIGFHQPTPALPVKGEGDFQSSVRKARRAIVALCER